MVPSFKFQVSSVGFAGQMVGWLNGWMAKWLDGCYAQRK